ncbi:NAD-dependent epimerase/dehydratase family protein [Candidatus Pelagibacter sp.]|nr:NAD-dependent epimerase/dehydratase family protein [Candidatus Pelagibacter sp.]
MKKNYIVVTGGVGFIGSNLIKYLINKTKFNIISLDNYSTGSKKNEIKNKRIKYIKSNTKSVSKNLNLYKKNIHSLFHFGEFSRIYQSFLKMNTCIDSNTIGSNEVFNFCLLNKIKLIYSATSASIGNKGEDKNLSPYAFTKAKNLELLENLKKWFNFKYEIIYFYNVYGPGQIKKGSMATVIGIFEDQFKKKIPLTIVRPGLQSRRFTHVFDTVEGCYFAWKKNMCQHYSVSHKKNYTIIEVAKMFNSKVKFLPSRKGERYASALTSINLSNKVHKIFGKINLKDYIINIVKNSKKRP